MAEEQWKELARTATIPLTEAWQGFDLGDPTANLGQASRTLARFNELTDRAIRAFSLYGSAHVGVLADGPLWQDTLAVRYPNQPWQSWVQSRDAALQSTLLPSQRLRTVAAFHLAVDDALAVAQSFPEGSQYPSAWMQASQNLAAARQGEASQALLRDTEQMRTAVGALVANGYKILDG